MSNKTKYRIGREQRNPTCIFKVDNPTYAIKAVSSCRRSIAYHVTVLFGTKLSGYHFVYWALTDMRRAPCKNDVVSNITRE